MPEDHRITREDVAHVADPEVTELAYDKTPLRPLLSLTTVVENLSANLGTITCPALVIVSEQDHVVPPPNSDHLAAMVAGPVQRETLERSYHVATLDYDKDRIAELATEFVRKVTAG